jgi:tripartite-type tricarboxylate transporter receptor subunit TctC
MITKRAILAGMPTLLAAPQVARAQGAWPSAPIRIVVPFPPGGGADGLARILQPRLQLELGVPIIIDNRPGASGALAKGDVYVPSKAGSIIYFDVPDIDPVVARAEALGARVLYPKTHTGEAGYVAEIEDSEGNRIALSAVAD